MPLYRLRALVGLIAMSLWFTAIATMNLGDAVALSFTAPLFATVGAVFLLGEMVRVRRWVSYHGVALNVEPDLSHFDGIVPCGIQGPGQNYGVTSLVDLGLPVAMADADAALRAAFEHVLEIPTRPADLAHILRPA